jgi:hypothetical protein
MRTVSAVVLAGACLALPSTASAQSSPLCPLDGGGSYAYQAALLPLIGGGSAPGGAGVASARAALGAQYGGAFYDTPRQGWSVALAPGALDITAARAAIVQALGAHFAPADAAFIEQHLNVLPTPYSEADLQAVQAQITSLVGPLINSVGIGCHETDGFRVRVGVTGDTPDVVAHVSGLMAPFGDKVYVRYGDPVIVAGVGEVTPEDLARENALRAPRVGAYATLPKAGKCVRGRTIGVRAKASKELRSVTLAAGKRHVSATAGKRARLRLTSRATKVTVTVTLSDGRTATKTVTYRRCG